MRALVNLQMEGKEESGILSKMQNNYFVVQPFLEHLHLLFNFF